MTLSKEQLENTDWERQRALGWNREIAEEPSEREHLNHYIALQMASAGFFTSR